MSRNNNLTIKDARIIFRNFKGVEDRYNREGDRNFAVCLDDPVAEEMAQDGWNIKWLKAREEGESEQAYLQVSVSFKVRPPRIILLSSNGRNQLGEREVEMLDWIDMAKVDLIVTPYNWEIGDKSGIKAYLKTMYVTIEEDDLDIEYAQLGDLPTRSGRVDE